MAIVCRSFVGDTRLAICTDIPLSMVPELLAKQGLDGKLVWKTGFYAHGLQRSWPLSGMCALDFTAHRA